MIVFMCASHNAQYIKLNIRANAYTVVLKDCQCGVDLCTAVQNDGTICERTTPCNIKNH